MIELIAIYISSKNIAEIAKEKGYSGGLWRFFAIISWLFFEFIGAVIGILLFGEDAGLLLYIPALIGAILGIYLVRMLIQNKPNLL
jgi:hypothetical protein